MSEDAIEKTNAPTWWKEYGALMCWKVDGNTNYMFEDAIERTNAPMWWKEYGALLCWKAYGNTNYMSEDRMVEITSDNFDMDEIDATIPVLIST